MGRPVGRARHRWKVDIKISYSEIRWRGFIQFNVRVRGGLLYSLMDLPVS
jgi:hypothetical protein